MLQELGSDDLALCLISGGGSALLSLPAKGVSLKDKQKINSKLLKSGASISEILIQFFGYGSILICIILTSWAYKLFFSKNLELFALNFLLLPITVFLLALFFEAVNLPISNGFIATQSLILINDTNVITNNYLNYSFITLIFIFFLISFYFTMGLKLEEWNSLLRFVWHITRASILFNQKLEFIT